MKLLSATIRHYRVHRERTVDFDPCRTLIGGPNECGKSTLIEALHRGLFLKGTVTGELRQDMLSTTHPGTPEVEISFLAEGAEYRLAKQFKGQGGTTKLMRVGGETWLGQQAESRLASLLGVEDAGSGRVNAGRIQDQWSHIWVWQGSSGHDPMSAAASQQPDLLAQLQEIGGAVAMQSAKDSQVASLFRERRAAIFTLGGTAKRGSALCDAQDDLVRAENAVSTAEERLQRLAQAVMDFEDACRRIANAASDWERLRGQQEELNRKAVRVEELERVEERQTAEAQRAAELLDAEEAIEKNIRELRETCSALRQSLSPRRQERERLEARLAEARLQKEDAERACDEAVDRTRAARLRAELAESYVKRFQQSTRCDDLAGRLERVRGLQEELDQVSRRISELGSIDEAALVEIRRIEGELGRASAALDAMSTEIEVLAGDRPVSVGGLVVAVGASRTVSTQTDVQIGESAAIRIHPGGGDNLRSAGDNVARLRQELRRKFDSHSVESLAQAEDLVAKKSELSSLRSSLEARLKEWKPQELQEAHSKAQSELVALDADLARRKEQVMDIWEPLGQDEASGWFEREKAALLDLAAGESALRGQRDALRDVLAERERALVDCKGSVEEDERKLAVADGQMELLQARHGADDARARSLDQARRGKMEADQCLRETTVEMTRLEPEVLRADRERLARALEELQKHRQEAEVDRGANQTLLRTDGTDDPTAAVVEARARRDRSRAHLERVRRKAEAIRTIDELFQQEQRTLADRFSRPLAEKIDGYLQRLFGPDAHVNVTFENSRFQGLKLVRSKEEGEISFADLSEGAKEQVAAGTRLAIAELLAAAHDESLPIVFDDSFAYSDPDRVHALQRMLDLAAERGLQVIVLTCNPSDYAGLGARQVSLR